MDAAKLHTDVVEKYKPDPDDDESAEYLLFPRRRTPVDMDVENLDMDAGNPTVDIATRIYKVRKPGSGRKAKLGEQDARSKHCPVQG